MSAAVFLLLLGVGAAATVALARSADTVNRFSGGYGPASDANSTALIHMLDAEASIRSFAVSGNPSALVPYRSAIRRVLPAIDATSAAMVTIGNHSLDERLATERRLAHDWITDVARPSAASAAAARRDTEDPRSRVAFERFRRANAWVAATLDEGRAALRHETDTQRTVVLPIVIGGAVLGLLLAAVMALRTARAVSRPLTALWDVVRRLEGGDLSARADESLGPTEVREVSAAVNSLAAERRRAVAVQRVDEVLRRDTRGLTAAIRLGHDPYAIARTLVPGLGRVFDVDRVWLITFDDARVPALSETWRRTADSTHGTADHPSARPGHGAADAALLRGLANRLWHSASVVGIADHERLPDTADPTIARAPQARGVRASAIAAVGEGNTAMGLLWLSVTDRVRAWSATELGLLQHVATELAQNLVQNYVLMQQERAMRRLREADESKTALVSTVSHELRTPLTSIVGYLNLLLDMDESELAPEVADMLRVIERNALRLQALIEDLLTQSQIEAGRRMVELSRTDLLDVLDDVEATIRPLADNAGLTLHVRPPERGALVVDGDGRQLDQAITNLAANAVKFTPSGGAVTIAASREDGTAVVEVSDTGIGIPPEEMPQLFERFFRATNARAAVIQGTGLGLAIVSEIVAQHDGRIEVRSELGIGTTFVLRLPLSEPTDGVDGADAALTA